MLYLATAALAFSAPTLPPTSNIRASMKKACPTDGRKQGSHNERGWLRREERRPCASFSSCLNHPKAIHMCTLSGAASYMRQHASVWFGSGGREYPKIHKLTKQNRYRCRDR